MQALAEAGHTVDYTVDLVYDSPDSTGAPSALIMKRQWSENGEEQVVEEIFSNRVEDYLDEELLRRGASIPNAQLIRSVADKLGIAVERVHERYLELVESPEGADLLAPAALGDVPDSPVPLSEQLAPEFEKRYLYERNPRGGHPKPESFQVLAEKSNVSRSTVVAAYRAYLLSRNATSATPRVEYYAREREALERIFPDLDPKTVDFEALGRKYNIPGPQVRYIYTEWAEARGLPLRPTRAILPTTGADFAEAFRAAARAGVPFDITPFRAHSRQVINRWLASLRKLHGAASPTVVPQQVSPSEIVRDNLEAIRDQVGRGVPLSQVAAQFGLNYNTLGRHLRKLAPELVTPTRVLEDSRDAVLAARRAGASRQDLAETYGVDVDVVTAFLARVGNSAGQVLEARRGEVLDMERAGASVRAIAKRFDVSDDAVRRYLQQQQSSVEAPSAPATDPVLSVPPPVGEGPVAEAGAVDPAGGPAGDQGAGEGSGSGSGGERAGDGRGPGGSTVAPEPDWTRPPEDASGGSRPGERVELPGGDGPVPEPAVPGEFDPNAGLGDRDPGPVVRELEGYPTRPDEQLEDALTQGGPPGVLRTPLGQREEVVSGSRPAGDGPVDGARQVVGSPALDQGGDGASSAPQGTWGVAPQQGGFGGGLGGVAQVQDQLRADLLEAAAGRWVDSTGDAPAAGVGAWIGREVVQPAGAVLEGVGRAAWEVVQDDPVSAQALPDGSGVRVSFAGGGWGDYDPNGYRIRGGEGTPDRVAPWRTPTVAGAFAELGAILEGLGKVAPFIPGLGGEQRQLGF